MEILTFVLVVITAGYAYVTYRMAMASEHSVALMREQIDSMARPYVCLSLVKQRNSPFIYLRIENTGKTSAHNMTLKWGPEFEKVMHLKLLAMLNSAYIFKNNIATFPPNSPIKYLFGVGDSLIQDEKNEVQIPLSITATYTFGKRTVSETTWLDVKQYHSTSLDKDPVVDAIDKLREVIDQKK